MVSRNRDAIAAGRTWHGQPLAIGYSRPVGASLALRDLVWTATTDGTRVARVELTSPGARALRVALALRSQDAGITVRVADAVGDVVVAAWPSAEITQATSRDGALWSPVVEGDTAIVEVEVPAGANPGATLDIAQVAHLVVSGPELRSPEAPVMRASGIGAAAPCHVDAACAIASDAALQTLARSVARLVFVGADGLSYLCSGTLLNDTARSNTPYLFTADHCIDSAAAARSIVSFWLFTATSCNGQDPPPYVQLTGGATLLARSQDNDWSLVRLSATPPPGTRLASWRAEPVAAGTPVVSLHHPRGDLLKANRGIATGTLPLADELVDGQFTEVTWRSGLTEGGSSGGLLATPDGGSYEVRGALYGGLSTCTRPADPDYFSRLETMLPLTREYLTPGATDPRGAVVAVEFHHAALRQYFLSTNPAEIDNLDSGRTPGWVRTGLRFLAYPVKVQGASPVCRLYRTPGHGASHFYSASPTECARTLAADPGAWIEESPTAFYLPLPDATSGRCPAGTLPLYRYLDRATGGHRYTVEQVTSRQLRTSPAWLAEGYGSGPLYPAMCALQP